MAEVTESILFRQKLYENFKDSGLLSKLKTTLRTNLLDKLKKPLTPSETSEYLIEAEKHKPIHLRKKFLASAIQ